MELHLSGLLYRPDGLRIFLSPMGHLENHGRLMKEFHSGKFLLSFDGKLDLYVKRYIFVTVHWQYPAKRVAVNSNIFSYRHDIV